MKKSIFKSLVFFTLVLMLVGCTKTIEKHLEHGKIPNYSDREASMIVERDMNEFKSITSNDYSKESFTLEFIGSCAGVTCLDDTILISDEKNDCLFVTKGDSLIGRVGNTGSGELEFIKPGAIKQYNGEIFILDRGSHRVQVLDLDLGFKRFIPLETKGKYDELLEYDNMAVFDTGIVLSTNGLPSIEIHLYSIEGENYSVVLEDFFGCLEANENSVYAINKVVPIYDKKELVSLRNGPGWFLKLSGEKNILKR